MAKAELTQGQSIQRCDPVTREGHLEDTGRIWVSWCSWAQAVLLQLSDSLLLRWALPGRMAM